MALVKPPADKMFSSTVRVRENVRQRTQDEVYLFTKRVMDICGALLGLLILSPLFLLISILIKLDDPAGSVFFKQIRLGENGRIFTIYKFRSMVHQAEDLLGALIEKNETSGPMFKMKNDPRVTRFGRFLRKTSLDEFPQLVNVLKGEMSLVGPRPPLPREVADYTDYDRQRLLVRPGCTGLWQVEGRSSVGFASMVKLDIEYINRRGILLDLKIILKTILIIFHARNAY
ncbi:sugar transferase [Sporolactobacillus vineae]|uniref:sugar transferase n=1 Tax=Sporolactobacillus vineae TaxID=444463 RepID=UPI000289187D